MRWKEYNLSNCQSVVLVDLGSPVSVSLPHCSVIYFQPKHVRMTPIQWVTLTRTFLALFSKTQGAIKNVILRTINLKFLCKIQVIKEPKITRTNNAQEVI